MSVPTTILSSAVPFAISTDGGVTFKNVVCKKTWNMAGTATVIEEETDCDTLVAVGSIKTDFGFEFVLNTTPNGATEWSADNVANMFFNKTSLVVKLSNGTTYYRSASGYFSAYNESAPQGGMVNGTGTFKVSGSVDTSL
jgi:hypothetical protein